MKVKDVIESMQNYNPEDEIVILWWTKDIFDDETLTITDDVWSKVVKVLDDENNLDFANSVISDEIYCALRDNEVDA
jgi:hypothetical protein